MQTGTESIINHLKSQLKSRGLSYKDLAKIWNVAESSVKRIMSGSDLSLERLETVCKYLEISLGDFMKTTQFDGSTQIFYLSDDQETKLSKDQELLHYFLLVDEGYSPADIAQNFVVSHEKATKFLLQLQKLNLIELFPHNRIKKKYMGQMRFRKDGPLAKILLEEMRADFLSSNFNKDDQYLSFVLLNFVPGSLQQFKLRIQNLIREMVVASEQSRNHPNKEEYGLLVATRNWPSPMYSVLSKRKQKI
jgi:DNA-binding Xre family transcriptional regulator